MTQNNDNKPQAPAAQPAGNNAPQQPASRESGTPQQEGTVRSFGSGLNPQQELQIRQQAIAFAFNRLSLTPVEKRPAEPFSMDDVLADAQTFFDYIVNGKK